MAWNGYISYAGNEVINVSRTETYAANAGLNWFKPIYNNDSLPQMLAEEYVSPMQDDAPWTDPDLPESYGFYGVFPLDVAGIEDSSRTSTVTESIRDGGNPGRLRHGSKTVVFNAVLIGDDDAACSYGFRWLKQVLLGDACGPDARSDCSGSDMCYLESEPMVNPDGVETTMVTADPLPQLDVDGGDATGAGVRIDYDGGDADDDGEQPIDLDGGDAFDTGPMSLTLVSEVINPVDCLPPLLRSLRRVVFNSGPTVTSKQTMFSGGEAWTVTFTAVAGDPWEYGTEVPVIQGFLDPAVSVPWVGGMPDGGYVDLDGALFNETKCATPVFAPLQDPHCPAVVPPPLPPTIPLGCYTPPVNWRRRQITIPASYIPAWGEVVPKFSIHARTADLRNLRLRFYADVDGDGDIADDPCAFCGDIVVSYVPLGSTLVFDTSMQQVYALDSSQRRRRADNVVFATDGTPFEWPVLTCGMGYVVTLDLPQTQAPPVFDLSLFSRAA